MYSLIVFEYACIDAEKDKSLRLRATKALYQLHLLPDNRAVLSAIIPPLLSHTTMLSTGKSNPRKGAALSSDNDYAVLSSHAQSVASVSYVRQIIMSLCSKSSETSKTKMNYKSFLRHIKWEVKIVSTTIIFCHCFIHYYSQTFFISPRCR